MSKPRTEWWKTFIPDAKEADLEGISINNFFLCFVMDPLQVNLKVLVLRLCHEAPVSSGD